MTKLLKSVVLLVMLCGQAPVIPVMDGTPITATSYSNNLGALLWWGPAPVRDWTSITNKTYINNLRAAESYYLNNYQQKPKQPTRGQMSIFVRRILDAVPNDENYSMYVYNTRSLGEIRTQDDFVFYVQNVYANIFGFSSLQKDLTYPQ